ncbi:malto-oligosyltrehalose trehalohydrolase [Sanguibacter suaedae]|uniref:Malto-oligosyltrehalose trehalohydrolase n=1 Tax=Sanguibacter suaedae TaxID=2795737 RepID=A0A934ME15_9MICO|nr:malto-oligosyltrehalose trehalohydrolase [Sanguibacter suaedae]MBI9115289.1 malto-oligosyltrehalose trehalohydrolase [Sanguibacter suaedae]
MTQTPYRPSVWAPSAQRVDVVLPPVDAAGFTEDDVRVALTPAPAPGLGDGWWTGDHELAPGTRYGFSVDGGPARPDPRSPRQPLGVHGPSEVFDTDAFEWTDETWNGTPLLGGVVYELHVGTFTEEGTLDAATGRLGHLVDLGVDVVELMPLAAFEGRHGWGYDGVALYAVHEAYGGPEALQRFVDAAHAAGLGVALDVVYNHLGPTGNYLAEMGPYFTDTHSTPWGSAVNLDAEGSFEVRRWIVDNALRWLRDFHVDALRLDAVHALVDDSPTHVLAELSDAVAGLSREVSRPLSLVAESDENDPATVTAVTDGGRGMTAQWADDVHHAIHAFMTGEQHGYYVDFGSVDVLRKALTGVFVHDGSMSTFRGEPWGHPVPRGIDARRFVVFSQDHDQVGNRARGDRPSAHLDDGGLAASAALVLLSPFTPMLFMGEEWGARTDWRYFTDFADADLGRAVTEGRTREFSGHGWDALYPEGFEVPDPQDPATRDASVLDWHELDHPRHARLLDWYRTLVRLRREDPDIASGDLDACTLDSDSDGQVLVLRRGAVRVVLNLGTTATALAGPAGTTLLAGWGDVTVRPTDGPGAQDAEIHVEVPARGVAVYREPTHT